MLAKRIIPCLDIKNGRVVKGTRFVNLVDAGDPVEVARHYDREGADELVFLDITATAEERPIVLDMVRRTAECVFLPLTVGGGVRAVEDFRVLLNAGADKVSVNSAAVRRPELIGEAARRHGRQCVVVAIDARRRCAGPRSRRFPWAARFRPGSPRSGVLRNEPSRDAKPKQTGTRALRDIEETRDAQPDQAAPLNRCDQEPHEAGWEVVIAGGRAPTGRDAVAWAREAVERGAGEILLTSMDCDGTNDGYDLELCRAVSDAVEAPVIASGGAGAPDHMVQALREGRADAALAAGIFHRREFSIAEVKQALRRAGLPVRCD